MGTGTVFATRRHRVTMKIGEATFMGLTVEGEDLDRLGRAKRLEHRFELPDLEGPGEMRNTDLDEAPYDVDVLELTLTRDEVGRFLRPHKRRP